MVTSELLSDNLQYHVKRIREFLEGVRIKNYNTPSV
jgi:hypothetical protein